MRCVGLDVHRDFCEVAIAEGGRVRHAGRIETSVAALELFAGSLAPDDQVVLEATGPAFAIARILRAHVARVVVANAQEVRAISHARVKSDRFDAATLARLLSADMLAAVWVCDERIGALRRRLARRAALVRQRTRAKNEVHAVISRCLLVRPPVSDLFGKAGRVWLAGHEVVEEERETVEGCLRQGQAASPGAARRRAAGHADRGAPSAPPQRARARTAAPSRAQLPAAGQRLAGDYEGRGRDTGARISKALEGHSSAADLKAPDGCALARRSPAPSPALSHRRRSRSTALDFHP
jgi:hypothetical protein